MSASKDLLGDLHSAVASELLMRIKSGEASAAELSTAIRFLKDNNIEAIASENDGLTELMKSLPDFDSEEYYQN
ncbi:DNA maturase A [Roseobacter phage CRP-403]|uniref:DNA maturase A n=1 Tax=Roseobacter phage CRP-403 TaxID=3072849 RepID=A0AAX3ZZK1_9CAUD|nr:DNA maturase A [Roseobacter phage CRP-403]